MIRTIVKKGSYQDSVVLMLLTNKISAMEGVNKVSIMMATPANKDIFKAGGLATEELLAAGANDMAIVVDAENESVIPCVLEAAEEFLNNQSAKAAGKNAPDSVRSWEKALEILPEANLAVISIPGAYAAAEADRALDEGLHVFMFSDNVSLEDEERLKRKAHEKGLVVMGPDCGTGIIQGVPIAFTNNVTPGKIGIVGASGTGIQELTTIIDRLGEGVTNAIGTGGRDLSTVVGGVTMLDAIDALEEDAATEVVIVLSKPPAKEIRDLIVKRLDGFSKPVVTLFLGEKPEVHEENFYHAYTLDEAARLAVQLVRGEKAAADGFRPDVTGYASADKRTIKGYYSGGTLAGEAAMMIRDTLGMAVGLGKQEGFMLNAGGHIVVDLGDDAYTQGKPHPMIDPAKRAECMREAMDDPATGVILFDVVLGYGSHEDMAGALLPCIGSLREKARQENRTVYFVSAICGTRKDYQGYDSQRRKLEDAGVIVCDSNKHAVQTALQLIGHPYRECEKPILPARKRDGGGHSAPGPLRELIGTKPRVINVGLRGFADVLREFRCSVAQLDWTPPAGGNMELIKTLRFLRSYRFTEQGD